MPSEQFITARQERILAFIAQTVRERGYPPTVREIGDAVGLTSSSSVHSQLENLQRKGLLHRDPTKPRALGLAAEARPEAAVVPLIGRIAAGTPVLATQDVEEYLPIPMGFVDGARHFALRVAGDSMIGAGIFDGDLVIVRQQDDADPGDIVVAVMPGEAEDEATVKRLSRKGGKVVLVPENPALQPFEMTAGRIAGKVVAVLRTL
jgi:repressor LexA